MEIFNILKPDMIKDKEALSFYFEYMEMKFGINITKMYYIQDWIAISRIIYEMDVCNLKLSSEEIKQRRKQILITILGYYMYYKNQQAIINLYNVDIKNPNILNQLSTFKKELRKRYVINTDKYYLKILNTSEIDFSLPLKLINLQNVKTETVIIPFSEEFNDPNYDMIFFNRIHFPDPNIGAIQNELRILNQNNIFDEDNLVGRLIR